MIDMTIQEIQTRKEDQTFDDIYRGDGVGQRINFVFKNVYINGNQHKIDLSNVRPITRSEIETLISEEIAKGNTDFDYENFPAIISIIPWKSNVQEGEILKGEYDVKIYDLELVGNCPIDYSGDLDGRKPLGVTYSGITVGERMHETIYHVDIKNVTVSQFRNGLMLEGIVGNGLVENVHAYNCFANGLELYSSILRLKDIKLGKCGAAGIELTPAKSNGAGVEFNEKQTITFEGSLDVSENYTNGATKYFTSYKIGGVYTIPDIIDTILSYYDENQQKHMKAVGKEDPYVFICFVLSDFDSLETNHSVPYYPGYQDGGIIKATELPTNGFDTTHQYIELDVLIDVNPAVSGLENVGKVLLYNHYYGMEVPEQA